MLIQLSETSYLYTMPLVDYSKIQKLAGIHESRELVAVDYLLITFGITILLILIPLINFLFTNLLNVIENWRTNHLRQIKILSLELTTPDGITDGMLVVAKSFRLILILLMSSVSLAFIFSIFPETQGLVLSLMDQFLLLLNSMGEKLKTFLPNIISLTLIITLTVFALKIIHFLSDGIQRGKIRLSGLHPDLVEPTFQLMRFFVIAIGLVAAYPYIPGSNSPVFRGVSIFIGFLLSLGSTSLVANIISGVVLTYTRGLQVGDRVEIADALGDVVDRNLLVTRIRTIKNVVITIPNGMVLNNHIINYSASAREKGLILNTTVTIGYDVPWRRVHELLIDAARMTKDILYKPEPFVFQTSLNDYYVSYELNAYTQKPSRMAAIYSELHQNIQDRFTEAGVEIMSPAYSALRDGNQTTIPLNKPSVGSLNRVYKPFSVGERKTKPLSH